MMWAVTTGWNIDEPNKFTECVIIQRVDGQEIGMNVVASSGPKVPNLLWLDVATDEGWAGKWWGRELKNW